MAELPDKFKQAVVVWYEDFEKWFKEVSGKQLDIMSDVGQSYGHYSYTELNIRVYNPANVSPEWQQWQDEFIHSDNDVFYTDFIEGYIEQHNLLPPGKYIVQVDW